MQMNFVPALELNENFTTLLLFLITSLMIVFEGFF